MITITIPGLPVPKARARSAVIGGSVRHYTPETTRAYEDRVRMAARVAMAKAPPMEGAALAVIVATLPVPESWSRAKRADALAGRVWPAARPDRDNLAKALQDGCNGIVWRDDAQVVIGLDIKRYGDAPGVVMTVAQAPAGVAAAAGVIMAMLADLVPVEG